MQLTANINGHSVSLTAAAGYADAAASGEMAALEIKIEGEMRVYARDDGRTSVLTLGFANREHMREIALLLLGKSGAPAFNEREWLEIADALMTAAAASPDAPTVQEQLRELANTITHAYTDPDLRTHANTHTGGPEHSR